MYVYPLAVENLLALFEAATIVWLR